MIIKSQHSSPFEFIKMDEAHWWNYITFTDVLTVCNCNYLSYWFCF